MLLDHTGFKVDGSVSCIELWGASKLFVGSSSGSLKCLGVQAQEAISEDVEEPIQYQLQEVARVREDGAEGKAPLHSAAVSAIAVHPVEETVLSAGEDGQIFVLQAEPAGSIVATKMNQPADWFAIYDVKYSSSGNEFFSAGAAGGLQMWDARSKSSVRKYSDGNDANIPYMSVEPIEQHLLAGRENGEISVFDTRFERGALYTHGSDTLEDGFHSSCVWTIRR
eukprot:113075-Rhodomonas_salina.3